MRMLIKVDKDFNFTPTIPFATEPEPLELTTVQCEYERKGDTVTMTRIIAKTDNKEFAAKLPSDENDDK